MRIVAALGGNALLRRGQQPTVENQRRNFRVAAQALAPIGMEHDLLITHGNGPQVGLLALQGAAYGRGNAYPLDVLDAETEGQIGYFIEQEMRNFLPADHPCVTLLTQTEVDPQDPAFKAPTKPIGPMYSKTDADELKRDRGWCFARDGESYRRVVPSPRPRRILELDVIALLAAQNVIVICAGGGGIPIICDPEGQLIGVEAVIDKDHASALLASELRADALLMLTDVDAVYAQWKVPPAQPIRKISTDSVRRLSFAPGSMAPKVEAACDFVEATGGLSVIGSLQDASAMLAGEAGTVITCTADETTYWE